MPPLQHIRNEILEKKAAAQDEVRKRYLADLQQYTGRDTIAYLSAYASHTLDIHGTDPSALQITTQDIQGFMSALHGLRGKSLDLILHSPGGSMEGAEQIVHYLRAKYDDIRAIVPHNAMSAATMVACACDRIVMGKHSALGPIDPQINFPTPNGFFTAPAKAVLDEFASIKSDIIQNPNLAALWAPKITSYHHGLLTMCENTLELAQVKVKEWLDTYMFRNSEKKGESVSRWLSDVNVHKSHGRPIAFEAARAHGLVVDALEDDQELQERVLSVFHATLTTFEVTNCCKIVENHQGRGLYILMKRKT